VSRRAFAWGIVAAALVVAATWVVGQRVPVRIPLDGLVPVLPYRWVRPPANLPPGGNQPAASVDGTLPLNSSGGLEGGSIATADGQAVVIFPKDGVAPKPGQHAIRVQITPLDPTTLPPPPAGLEIDGNGYRIEGTYEPSGAPLLIVKPATVVLRYPVHAEKLLRLTGQVWAVLETITFATSLQVYAFTDQLGIFVTARPPVALSGLRAWWPYLAGGVVILGLLAGLAAFLLTRRRAAPPDRTST
jgi:hypothetical protein